MDLLLALSTIAAFVATAVAIGAPEPLPDRQADGGSHVGGDAAPRDRFARVAVAILWVTAVACVAHGLLGPTERELVCRHTFVGFEGMALEPSPVHFPTETTHAPGWQWPLPYVGFCLLWTLLLAMRARLSQPFVLPLLFAWSATALWLVWQKLAAPAELVQPVGLDRFLWPAGLALALRLARHVQRLVPVVLYLSLGVVVLRLPAAVFSKIASDQGLGTSLDVSSIVHFVHPLTRLQFEPPLEPGSGDQQFWLIWAENVIAYPAFHLLSLTGVAFAAFMLARHSRMPD